MRVIIVPATETVAMMTTETISVHAKKVSIEIEGISYSP